MPDQKTMWTRCLGGFSVMWVTKLLISEVKKRIFCPKTTKFGPKLAFLVNLGQAMQAYSMPCCGSVGGCGARAVSRKTPIYFILLSAYLRTRQCWWKMKSLMQTKMVWSSRPWQQIAIFGYKNFPERKLEVIRFTITCESSRNKPSLFSLVCGSNVDDHGKLSCQENIHHRDDKSICSH